MRVGRFAKITTRDKRTAPEGNPPRNAPSRLGRERGTMAFFVLALGAVLSVWGAVSMYFGYGIVEVERGWTGVIAGATCLAGGTIVMALGLVIKGLGDVRGALSALSQPAGIQTNAARVRAGAAPYSLDFEAGPVQGETAEPASPVTGDLQSGMLATIMASPESQPDTPDMSVAPADSASASMPDPVPARPSLFEIKAPDASYTKPRQRVTMKPQPAPPRKEEPQPVPAPEPDAVPSMDDWLDRAFSALDNEVATSPAQTILPAHHQEPEPPQTAGDHGELAHQDAGAELHEPLAHELDAAEIPAHVDALHAAPPQPDLASTPDHHPPARNPEPMLEAAAPLLVLEPVETGRYETDGTTYIMYSDGAIDVQSEAGTYRFASMAELKAYIEGTA